MNEMILMTKVEGEKIGLPLPQPTDLVRVEVPTSLSPEQLAHLDEWASSHDECLFCAHPNPRGTIRCQVCRHHVNDRS